jgi:excinuclease ABC subunit A
MKQSPQKNALRIIKARENNLKEISLTIPHDDVTVVTGLSGSGKSSLAFDTVYAEGQRRYIETFSPYTRQFFDKVKRPAVDLIENVRPAIAIEQRTRVTNSRSTVGSLTSLNEYLKVLWANLSSPTCPQCGKALTAMPPRSIVARLLDKVATVPEYAAIICAPVKLGGDGASGKTKKISVKQQLSLVKGEIERLLTLGFTRVFKPGVGISELSPDAISETQLGDRILVALDRIRGEIQDHKRIEESLQQAYSLGGGKLIIAERSGEGAYALTPLHLNPTCIEHGVELPRPTLALFSYNSPLGACPTCRGFGNTLVIDLGRCVPDENKSLAEGAIQCWTGKKTSWERAQLKKFCKAHDIPFDVPWRELPQAAREAIAVTDTKEFYGILPWFQWLEGKSYKMHVRVFLSRYRMQKLCPNCNGSRLIPTALAYKLEDMDLGTIAKCTMEELAQWLQKIATTRSKELVASPELAEVLHAIQLRVEYLKALGLPYLSLDRQARTLSGGETQRVNLAAALGSNLVSTQFVLDEPTVGLHARDTQKLIRAIHDLAERGNSVLVVEHDPEVIDQANTIIELGPKAGSAGGEIVYAGPRSAWQGMPFGAEILVRKQLPITDDLPLIGVDHCRVRNLKDISLSLPLLRFVCLTGVSGSGKSTVLREVLFRGSELKNAGSIVPPELGVIKGLENVAEVRLVDQSPLAKSPRANIATYSGVWDKVRSLLAATPEAKERGLTASAFSFNVDAGRCKSCQGAGFIREDMQFLSDVFIPCEICLGKRFQPHVLEVTVNGRTVADFLEMSVDDAVVFFHEEIRTADACRILAMLGLGHLRLGHPLSELSGGEAQRLKLVPQLEQFGKGGALLLFDEPTNGLHLDDIKRLITLFDLLLKRGHSIVCVEHNLALLANADWIIDLGPEGGEGGGEIVRIGTPADFIAKVRPESATAEHLRGYVKKDGLETRSKAVALRAPRAEELVIKGARVHNLKNIDVHVPLQQVVAFTGVSGSGKSSIAKDIIYAEGQRRYLDCLSPYARQFIKELQRPAIDEIRNVMPTLCVYQHTFQPSGNSTVGTMSEVYNYLRLLFAKIGIQHCPDHPQHRIAALAPREIAEELRRMRAKRVKLLAPVIKGKKGHHRPVFERAIKSEVHEVRVDGVLGSPGNFIEGLTRHQLHTIEFVISDFDPKTVPLALLEEALAQALAYGGGSVVALAGKVEQVLSTERTCPECHRGFFKPDPEDLSFHSKRGACSACHGSGYQEKGGKEIVCSECHGARINPNGLALRLDGLNIHDVALLKAPELVAFLQDLSLSEREKVLAEPVLHEVQSKLALLERLGLGYVALNRACNSLSGGELQRLRLATAMGSPLAGVLYIFDEPSAGLHPVDNKPVMEELQRLKARGNSVILIEHDVRSIRSADYVIELGPGGGKDGGNITFAGELEKFLPRLQEMEMISLLEETALAEQPAPSTFLKVTNGECHTIHGLALDLPLQTLIGVGGVSGAGKSSFVHGILAETFRNGSQKHLPDKNVYRWVSASGALATSVPVQRIISVDQAPIGKNSRSTPASYLGIWDEVRKLFALLPESKARNWTAGFFSYNSGKGRCQNCQGLGQIRLEMSFLPDAVTECEVCGGKRYSLDADSVRFRGLSISDVLQLTFAEAKSYFAHHRNIHQALHLACDLGLGYLTLGQSSATLSGGECQRLKLVAELSLRRRDHTIYLLDEPTTGLHPLDVARLIRSLKALVAKGNTVIVIEHDEQLLAAADFFVEFGPGPGERGGKLLFAGTVGELVNTKTPWALLLRKDRRMLAQMAM